MTDLSWLANEAKAIHSTFSSFFYLVVCLLLVTGVVLEFFKIPLGETPSFVQLVVRAIIAAILLKAYPDIANAIAGITESIADKIGGLNNIDLVLSRMSDKFDQLTWSWVNIKESVILLISFLTFFLLYFSIYITDAFQLYAWVVLFTFSPLLIGLYVLPITASATRALFGSLIEISCWKIVWAVIAALLWSSALSDINSAKADINFLTAICFNVILAGSLLLTPFIVHALKGSGIAGMTKNVGAMAIGGMVVSPGTGIAVAKKMNNKIESGFKAHFKKSDDDNNDPRAPGKKRYPVKRKISAK